MTTTQEFRAKDASMRTTVRPADAPPHPVRASLAHDEPRLDRVSGRLRQMLDLAGLACLGCAAGALVSFLWVDELSVQADHFQVFRIALMMAVASFLTARSVQIAQRLRDDEPVRCRQATVVPRVTPAPSMRPPPRLDHAA